MIRLEYTFDDYGTQIDYTIHQYHINDYYAVWKDKELLGAIEKTQNTWKQIHGRSLEVRLITELGKYIDNQHYQSFPGEIKQKWPEEVVDAQALSDEEYLVIVKDNIDINQFASTFKDEITDLVKDDGQLQFHLSKKIVDESVMVEIN